MSEKIITPEELVKIDYHPPKRSWTDPAVEFKSGFYNYAANPDHQHYLDLPGEKWQPPDDDWPLPDGWEKKLMASFRDKLNKYRSLGLMTCGTSSCGMMGFINTTSP